MRNSAQVAFLEVLGSRRALQVEPGQEVMAGFLLVKAASDYRSGASPNELGLDGIRAWIGNAEFPGAVHVMNALDSLEGEDDESLIEALMRFARTLEGEALWELAGAIYRSLIRDSDPPGRINCLLRLWQVYLNCDALDRSSRALRRAQALARKIGDRERELRAALGQATLAIYRGDLLFAKRRARRVLRLSRARDFNDVVSRSFHVACHVAQQEREFRKAVLLAHEALRHCVDPRERDRILGDMAAALMGCGALAIARDAYTTIAAEGKEALGRWTATLNLIEIASLERDSIAFETLRDQLAGQWLSPMYAAYQQLNLGMGFRRFGRLELAAEHLKNALSQAAEHGWPRIMEEARDELANLNAPVPETPRAEPGLFPQVEETLRSLRSSSVEA